MIITVVSRLIIAHRINNYNHTITTKTKNDDFGHTRINYRPIRIINIKYDILILIIISKSITDHTGQLIIIIKQINT